MHQLAKHNAMVEITNATRVSLVGLKLVMGRTAFVSVTDCVREIQTNVTVHFKCYAFTYTGCTTRILHNGASMQLNIEIELFLEISVIEE